MNAVEAIASELIKELQTTRKLLERVPEERFEWKPHPKSMSVRQRVSHIATSAEWMGVTLSQTEFVLDRSHVPFGADSSEELLRVFDANGSKAVSMLREQTGETLSVKWRLFSGGRVVFELPRAVLSAV